MHRGSIRLTRRVVASERRRGRPGAAQLAWLQRRLLESTATWKLIANDIATSLVVKDLNKHVPQGNFEVWANADNGPPSGGELEIANDQVGGKALYKIDIEPQA